MEQKDPASRAAVTFHFRNIGPVKHAELELGNLTIIAGRNNTGKTYLVYTLYGFLKMWNSWPELERFLLDDDNSSTGLPDLRQTARQLAREGRASIGITDDIIKRQRAAVIAALTHDFSEVAIAQVFSSQHGDFEGASMEIVHTGNGSEGADSTVAKYALPDGISLSIQRQGNEVIMTLDKTGQRSSASRLELFVAFAYSVLLLRDLFPEPFILSAERFGISLFYRELDFTKNQLVDILQKMGDDRNHETLSPFLVIDRATSRYALPIKDNIDYTRSIPDRKNDKSKFLQDNLFNNVKDMMGGYYRASSAEIRFISRARGPGRSFNIPLHLASSSVRGLSDLYFFLRHVAKDNHLLIMDEPESHLDTENQILLARLLARFVRTGLKVLVTTHSDYLIKEINNLVMLSSDFDRKDEVVKKLRYTPDDVLDPESIRAYVAERNGLTRCNVDSFGIDMPLFDKTIDRINSAANELASWLHHKRES